MGIAEAIAITMIVNAKNLAMMFLFLAAFIGRNNQAEARGSQEMRG
jgi:hypothetical protein